MSKKELNQVEVLSMVKSGAIKLKKAAELCNLSNRQIIRKYKEYKNNGPEAIAHKSRGKPSNRSINKSIIQKIIDLIICRYTGFGPTLLSEKLAENHNIKLNHETLRKIMIKNELYKPKKRKAVKRTWREPKHHAGELVQLDGSDHIWFNNIRSTLILFIDDATREIFAQFQPESIDGVTKTFRLFIEKYGIPRALYTDKGKVFKVNTNAGKNSGAITQFKRMCDELGCEIKYAYSPQAKGRVERVFRTLQDRLAKELKLKNITNVDDANAMLRDFLVKFNSKFSILPLNSQSLYRSSEKYNLNYILCYKFYRILNNDYTIAYKNKWYQLGKSQTAKLYAKDVIDVYEDFDGTISLWKNGIKLNCHPIEKRVITKPEVIKAMSIKSQFPRRPNSNHPWRRDFRKQSDISKELKR